VRQGLLAITRRRISRPVQPPNAVHVYRLEVQGMPVRGLERPPDAGYPKGTEQAPPPLLHAPAPPPSPRPQARSPPSARMARRLPRRKAASKRALARVAA
jgi:hypothetical protein